MAKFGSALQVRISTAQRAHLEELSARIGVNEATLVRFALESALPLGERLSKRAVDELLVELAETDHELKQIDEAYGAAQQG